VTNALIISSGKGGTGKTTAAVNMGVAMAQMGREVLLVDASLPTPDVGLHLGLPFRLKTLNHVLSGESEIGEAIFIHQSGLEVLPASIHMGTYRDLAPEDLEWALGEVKGMYDWVIIDSAAGLGREVEKSIEVADKMLVVTNPELPSVADSFKAVQLAEEVGTEPMGVIVNRTGRFYGELSDEEIMTVMGDVPGIKGRIPEDRNVPKAISDSQPVVMRYPHSPASMAYKKVAAGLLGMEHVDDRNIFDRLRCFLRGY
jgi:septum site-determining protein MinD